MNISKYFVKVQQPPAQPRAQPQNVIDGSGNRAISCWNVARCFSSAGFGGICGGLATWYQHIAKESGSLCGDHPDGRKAECNNLGVFPIIVAILAFFTIFFLGFEIVVPKPEPPVAQVTTIPVQAG